MAEKKYKHMKVKERKALPKVTLSAAAVLGVAAFGANAHGIVQQLLHQISKW